MREYDEKKQEEMKKQVSLMLFFILPTFNPQRRPYNHHKTIFRFIYVYIKYLCLCFEIVGFDVGLCQLRAIRLYNN